MADGKIDVEALRGLLDDDAAGPMERFGLLWPGKREAQRLAQTPTTATLEPDRENSRDWDTTQNVVIEGDNLEVLKVLQRHYFGQIKMIYIDPPYNTGKDFVYSDDYRDGVGHYLEWTEQVTENGKTSTNVDTAGRFHSNWLNMMYPRLKLARNLLSEDGVIFISIDEGESAHLRSLCNEIFGDHEYVAEIVWQSRTSISDDSEISRNHNSTLIYARSKSLLTFWGEPLRSSEYSNPDGDPRGPWKLVPLDANKPGGDTFYPVLNPETGVEFFPPAGRSWAINPETMSRLIAEERVMFGLKGTSAPKKKLFLREREERGDTRTPSSLLLDAGSTKDGSEEVQSLFGKKKIFDYPKPTSFITRLLRYGTLGDKQALILDFFAGSGTTAHAVMQLNAEDGGNRRCISVQLPEPTPENSPAREAGFDTISQITRERIRRAGEKILSDQAAQLSARSTPLDVGFRAYRLSDTHFRKWTLDSNTSTEELNAHLALAYDSAEDEATPEQLFTEVALKHGLSLTESYAITTIAGLEMFSIEEGLILGYFNEHVTPTLEQLRTVIDTHPGQLFMLEDVFAGNDELKANLAQLCSSRDVELVIA